MNAQHLHKRRGDLPMEPRLSRGTKVVTPDGPGEVLSRSMRRNTNGGPGCHEYVVQLTDGRVRHYNANTVTPPKDQQEGECP
jgi:hypothetical protein